MSGSSENHATGRGRRSNFVRYRRKSVRSLEFHYGGKPAAICQGRGRDGSNERASPMATTFYIDGVRTERPDGYTHEHITHVRLRGTDVLLTRNLVLNDLRTIGGDRYYTIDQYGNTAKVIIGRCPRCSSGDYITTEADWTTTDNLLSLPRV